MKKLLALVTFLLLAYCVLNAAPPVSEAPIKEAGTPVTIAISSTTLTKVPTTQTTGRVGVYVVNPSTTAVAGFLGNCSSTALASTIRPFQIALNSANSISGGSGINYIDVRDDVCLWLISLNVVSDSQNIHIQEVKR